MKIKGKEAKNYDFTMRGQLLKKKCLLDKDTY